MKLIIKVFLLVTVISSCQNLKKNNENLLEWISKTSNFEFPSTYQKISVFEGNEWGKIVKLNYDSVTIHQILDRIPFSKVEFKKINMVMIKDLDQELYHFYNSNNYILNQFSDCENNYEWTAIIDSSSSILFFEIIQRDFSGDKNKCP